MQTTNEPLNILVGIDLSEMDTYLFNYLHTLDQILDINKITFLHNIKITELPAVMVSEGRLDVIKGKIISSITRDINATALNHPFEIQVTSERFSETSFNKISERQAFDLLILGNKQNLRGNGALAYKLVRLFSARSEEHTSELQSRPHLVCRLLLEKKKKKTSNIIRQKTKKKISYTLSTIDLKHQASIKTKKTLIEQRSNQQQHH